MSLAATIRRLEKFPLLHREEGGFSKGGVERHNSLTYSIDPRDDGDHE